MKRGLTIGFVGVALGGSAALGIITAQTSRADLQTAPRFDQLLEMIPEYPDATFYPMGRELRVDGAPREMGFAVTDHPPRKVGDRYEAIWETQGYEVNRYTKEHEEWVTAFVQGGIWMRSVGASVNEDGTTTILASVSKMFERRAPPAPVPELCDINSALGGRDGRVETDVLMLGCDGLVKEVVTFYDGVLRDAERTADMIPEADRRVAYVTYQRADLHVTLAVNQATDDPPRVSATVTWQERK